MKSAFIVYMVVAAIFDFVIGIKIDLAIRRMLGITSTWGSLEWEEGAFGAAMAALDGLGGIASWIANIVLRFFFVAGILIALVVEGLIGALLFHVPFSQLFS